MQPPPRPGAGQAARSGQGASGGAARTGPGAARKHLNTKVLSGVLRQVKNNVPKNYLAPFLVSMYAIAETLVPASTAAEGDEHCAEDQLIPNVVGDGVQQLQCVSSVSAVPQQVKNSMPKRLQSYMLVSLCFGSHFTGGSE